MTPKLKFLSLFTLLLVFQNSYSADFQFSEPVLSGSGCPIGTARASLSPDGSALTLLFDQFLVNGKKGGNHYLDMRKFCRFQIPVSLPPGQAIVATQIDYRGYVMAKGGNKAFLVTAGPLTNMGEFSVGEQSIKTEFRNREQDFIVTQPIPLRGRPKCSTSTVLDFNVVLQLMGPSGRGPLYLLEEASVALDSMDLGQEAPISLKIKMVPCR